MRFLSCLLLAVWSIGSPLAEVALSQNSPTNTSDSTRQIEEQGLSHFYSLEYDEAIASFQKLREVEPNNPTWRNHLAGAYFYKQLLIAGLLEGDLFTSTNGLFKRKKVDPDPALEKGFWDANNAAIQLCEQSLKQNDKNQDALYSCGVAYAGRASYLAIIERSKFDTLSSARRAANYHNELSQLNPQCYDAHLIPGIYDFALGSLPHSLRMLLFLGGYTGDKERGLHAVEDAANRGNLARTDAQIFLAVMYRRERRYADAQRTLRDLAEAFPRNYIFQLEIASIHRHAGEDKEAIVVYEQMLEDVRLGKPGYAAAPVARIHYELADLYLKTANLASARSHVDQVAGSFGSTPELERQGADLRRRIDAAKQQPAKQETPAAGATLSSASIG